MDFAAIYLPSLRPTQESPSKGGFSTRGDAENYVFSQMCDACKQEREEALAGKDKEEEFEYRPSAYPGCYFEWAIAPDKDYNNFEELMKAAGWETIWSKDDDKR